MLSIIRILIPVPVSYLMIHLAIERHSIVFSAVLWYRYELNQSIAEYRISPTRHYKLN